MTEGENIKKELEGIAPEMQWNLQEPDFKVPDSYFTHFAGTVMDKIRSESEETFARDFANNNVYTVPDNYFEAAPQKILEKIRVPHRVVPLPRRRKYQKGWAVAASMAVFVALAGILSIPKHTADSRLNTQLAGISENAIEQYLNTHVSLLNSEDLFDYITTSDIQNTITHDFSTHDIEEYLEDNSYPPDNL